MILLQNHQMPKSSASSSALETYGRGQERLYDESQLASSSVANRTREDANEVERLPKLLNYKGSFSTAVSRKTAVDKWATY